MHTKITLAVFLVAAIILIAGGIFLVGAFSHYAPEPSFRATNSYTLAGSEIQVRVARSAKEITEGLAGVTRLDKDKGMLFELSRPLQINFWNKGMLIPVDIVWLREGVVIGIARLLEESREGRVVVSSPGLVDQVLELPYGWAQERRLEIGARFLQGKERQ